MAKNRYVNTAVWKDPWYVDLRLTEQHLWLYLLTNGQTNMLGVYEISLREMAFDTTIDQEELKRIFRDRFQPDGRAHFERGFIVMKNWIKHQSYSAKSIIAVCKAWNALPEWLRNDLADKTNPLYLNLDTLLIGYGYSIDNSNSNLIININPNAKNEHRSYTQSGDSLASRRRRLADGKSF